jgi:hypothetical protein
LEALVLEERPPWRQQGLQNDEQRTLSCVVALFMLMIGLRFAMGAIFAAAAADGSGEASRVTLFFILIYNQK